MDLNSLQAGDTIPQAEYGPITRTQLALFAGASGDHNPIHLDDEEARKVGLPGVIVHGMLTMAILARMLTDIASQDRIRSYTSRFKAMAFPGDILTCTATVSGRGEVDGEERLDLAIAALNQNGEAVLEGTAQVAV